CFCHNMKRGALLLTFVVAALAVADAQQFGELLNFPFCKCESLESPYRLSSTVKAHGGGKFCFALNVAPTPGCTSHCCTKADLKKITFNVRNECDVVGVAVKATVNGVPTKVAADFDLPDHGPPGSTILRLTQLGLGMDSDGAELCITLLSNNAGKGCTTLEDLCVPPPGQPAGVCSAALFDTQQDCCPISNVNTPDSMMSVMMALSQSQPTLPSLQHSSVLSTSPAPTPPPPQDPSPLPPLSLPSPPPPLPPLSPPPPSPAPPSPPPPSPPPPSPPPPSPPPPSPAPLSPPPPSPPPPSPPPPSPPPPSPPPPSPPPPSPPPPSPPPPSPPPPSPPPPSPPPPSPPPPSPPPPSPPPPSPPPPSPPPPSPPPPPSALPSSSPTLLPPASPLLASASNHPPSPGRCTFCTYLTITPIKPLYPINITTSQCNVFAELVVADVIAKAQVIDAILLSDPPSISCSSHQVKVCGLFASNAEGAKLQPWIEARVADWLSVVTDLTTCPAFLNGYDVTVATGGDGQWPNLPASCLNATRAVACRPQKIPFPKCACNTQYQITPFAALPVLFKAPGRKNTTSLYCFITDVVTPYDVNSPCGSTSGLMKAEIWANETQRYKVIAVGVQPGDSDTLSFRAATWGAKGEQTLRVTPLNWNPAQAKGGKICLEVDGSTSLTTLCNGVLNTCWINFFSHTKKCCPLYAVSFVGDEVESSRL
ncbi:hypothetical protein VaNZ11_008366, partial [Volvox africanus]